MKEQSKKTKIKLLEIAQSLMMAKGYNATTVEEICTLSELTKGAFFYYFKSKEELGAAVLNHYWQKRKEQFSVMDLQVSTKPLEQIQAFLSLVADVFMRDENGCSCLAGSFAQELAATHPQFQEQVSQLFEEWTAQIKPILAAAKAESPKAENVNLDTLADYIVALIEGTIILALARQDSNLIGQQIKMLNQHLELVFAA